jgi:hypothetical protein
MAPRVELIVLSVALLLVAACEERLPIPGRGEPVRRECPATSDHDHFFVEGSLVPADPIRDYERRISLSSYLVAAKAVSLSCGSGGDAYRLIWGGGYDNPLVIATVGERAASLTEFLPFNVAIRSIKQVTSANISSAQFLDLVSRLESANFWSVDAVRVFESEGSGWTFEGRRGQLYRTITRTHPEGPLANAGKFLAELTGAPVPAGMSVRTP